MPTMLDNRGPEYVKAWPVNTATAMGIPTHFVVRAVKAVTGQDIEDGGCGYADDDKTLAVVGNLDGPTAKEILALAGQNYAEYKRATRNHCHFCGLPMRNGRCEECV